MLINTLDWCSDVREELQGRMGCKWLAVIMLTSSALNQARIQAKKTSDSDRVLTIVAACTI
jgi:hypothetical protein